MKTILCLFFCFSVSFSTLFAQTKPKFESYGVEKSMILFGLINSIAIDDDNVKWIGTEGGLLRIEGDNADIFNANNSNMPTNRINVVLADDMGNKWLGTYNKGIIKMGLGGDFSTFPLPKDGKNSHLVTALAADQAGNKWVGTRTGGLWKINLDGKLKHFTAENSQLTSEKINCITVDKNGTVWVGSDAGLYKISKGTWQVERPTEKITSITLAENGDNWLNIQKENEHTILKNGKVVKNKQFRKMSFQLEALLVDKLNRLWASTNGLAQYQDKVWQLFNADNSNFPALRATCLAMEEDGVLWIGTQSKGILTLDLSDDYKKLKKEIQEAQSQEVTQKDSTENQVQEVVEVAETTITYQGEKVAEGETVALKNVHFDPTSSELKDVSSINAVEELFILLLDNPKMQIELAGHTDKDPEKSHPNYERIKQQHLELSEKRVNIVYQYLIDRGIREKRLTTKAYGGAHPLVNTNSEKNRRVEVKVLKID